ncbi:MAG: hypothetical protein NZ960_07630 [Candidatus Kapabacteria bacterium]|nr:hypothetical protein [Candidatus Kapabacteria bacterium]MDW8011986.1 hypothetical protein [Bacteroidota bacterium]
MTPRHRLHSPSATVRFVPNVGLFTGCVALVIFLQSELSAVALVLRAFVVFVVAVGLTTLAILLLRRSGNSSRKENPLEDSTEV